MLGVLAGLNIDTVEGLTVVAAKSGALLDPKIDGALVVDCTVVGPKIELVCNCGWAPKVFTTVVVVAAVVLLAPTSLEKLNTEAGEVLLPNTAAAGFANKEVATVDVCGFCKNERFFEASCGCTENCVRGATAAFAVGFIMPGLLTTVLTSAPNN